MKILKKFLAFLAVLLAGCTAALLPAGCSVSSAPNGSELPADGIVRRSVFQDAEKSSRMLTFHGKSGEFSYVWFFDGASIRAPSDQNLKVDLSDAGDSLPGAVFSSDLIKIHFHEKHLIQAKTTLRIDFPALLNAQKVRLYRKDPGKTERLLEAPLNQGKRSSVTLPVSDTNGEFYLAAMDPSFREGPSKDAPYRRDGSKVPSAGVSSGRAPASGGDANSASGSGAAPKAQGTPASGGTNGKGRNRTDPASPEKPKSAEPNRAERDARKTGYCTLSIDCRTVLNHMDRLSRSKKSFIPAGGVVFPSQEVLFYQGESAFDVLLRETKKNGIQMEYEATPAYRSCYIEGIHNLYEFDCGSLSGWMYEVNGRYPNYGCSRYRLKNGDVVNWRYTCDLGRDVGCGWNVSQK